MVPPIIPMLVRSLGQLVVLEVGLVMVRVTELWVAKRLVTGANAKDDLRVVGRTNEERKAPWKGFAVNLAKVGRNIMMDGKAKGDGDRR